MIYAIKYSHFTGKYQVINLQTGIAQSGGWTREAALTVAGLLNAVAKREAPKNGEQEKAA